MAEVMSSLTAGTLIGMILLPVAGVMLDRYPVRWIMTAGTLLFAAGLWTLANTTSITQYVVVFGATMAAANAFAGATASQTVISRWFTRSRGRALGISAVGTSVGGIAIPVLVTRWLNAADWRVVLENLSLCVALFMLPLVVLTIRGKPSDVGLLPEGSDADGPAHEAGPQLSLADVVRHPAYWYIGLTLGILFSVYSSMLANLASYALGLGASAAQSSSLIMAVAIAGLLGKIVFGLAADKVNLKVGLWIAMGLVLVAFLVMASEPGYSLMMLAAILLGLAAGGMLPVWGAMMARVFGLVSYGRAMGLMGPLITLTVMPGFVLTGYLFDTTGGYQVSLLIYAAVIALASLLLVPLKLTLIEARAERTALPG